MTNETNEATLLTPNHHRDHPGFSGVTGWIAVMSMRRRGSDGAELAIGLTNLTRGDRLVDIGCGPGVAARRAAEQGVTVIGIDPAEVMPRASTRSTSRPTRAYAARCSPCSPTQPPDRDRHFGGRCGEDGYEVGYTVERRAE
jgi:SAM-dependent methyltransferase